METEEEPIGNKPSCSSESKVVTTRKSSEIFGVGAGISSADSEITGSKLPNCNQVLRSMLFHIKDGAEINRTKFQASEIVLSKIIPFYQKANIPMVSQLYACNKIVKLVDDNQKFRNIPINRRESLSVKTKIEKVNEELKQTFRLWPQNVEDLLKNEEDKKFLLSMQTDRTASFGPKDKSLADLIKRRQERNRDEIARKEKSKKDLEQLFKSTSLKDSDEDESKGITESSIGTIHTPKSHKRKKIGTEAFISENILKSPRLVSLATRIKMTPTQQAAFTKTFIEEVGGDVSKVKTSWKTADRSRRQVGRMIAENTKNEWTVPKFGCLHWDSKSMPSLNNKNKIEERMVVAISSGTHMKILGIPSYEIGTTERAGSIITRLCCALIDEWNCFDSVVCMVFDTTASNTGHISAGCISLQGALGRPLLWCACRHHIGELVISQIFSDLGIELSKSPETSLFLKLRKNWENVPHSRDEDLMRLDITDIDVQKQELVNFLRQDTLSVLNEKYEFFRDDYKEFIELSLMYLDESFLPNGNEIFKRPGAVHKARWMAKVIYLIKISLLQGQINMLPEDTITKQQQTSKIKEMVTFIVLIYVNWWVQCSSALNAPYNDLKLIKKIAIYRSINETISESAFSAFTRHLWYLSSEMIPLSLFSSSVPDCERKAVAQMLLTRRPIDCRNQPSKRHGTGYGKPTFPVINERTRLCDLVDEDSWFLFKVFEINTDFLSNPVSEWPQDARFLDGAKKLENINVVNDFAERGVKLSADFLSSAKSEMHYQNVLQVVEKDRKENPNLRKTSNNN